MKVLLYRDGRLGCRFTIDSEDAASSFAHKWLVSETRRLGPLVHLAAVVAADDAQLNVDRRSSRTTETEH